MNIRTRIVLGYGYLVALLLATAAGAALGFHRFSVTIGDVLAENFDSVRASMDMLVALERHDTAVLGVLLDDPEQAAPLEQSEEQFLAALEAARRSSTLPNEEQLRRIEDRFHVFRAARDQLLESVPPQPLRAYDAATFPRFDETRAAVLDLVDANHQHMQLADQGVQRRAVRIAAVLGLLVVVAVLSFVGLSRSMQRNVLDRLTELRSVADAVAAGDRTRRTPVSRQDELASVARQLNAALDAGQAIEAEMRVRVTWYRQLLLGVFHGTCSPGTLLTLAGDVVASSLPDADAAIVERVRRELVDDRSLMRGVQDEVDHIDRAGPDGARVIRFRRLTSPGAAPVGWLASFVDEDAPAV